MDVDKLKTIHRILEKSSVDEVIVEASNFRLRMKKGVSQKAEKTSYKEALPSVDKVSSVETSPKQQQEDKSENLDILSSQIGFFSRFNKKTKKQYVKLRDIVKKGDIVGTITSMHIEHNVFAEKEGKIVEFLVEEGQPVEYHQPIIRLAGEK